MTKTYNITREAAAKVLNVSTRTIDRYVKSGKLSYKKIANKVLLAKEEIQDLGQEFAALRQEMNSEIVGGFQSQNNNINSNSNNMSIKNSLEEGIDEKVDKFFLIFKEKDKMLDEKNKIIFMLQQKISDLEAKLQNMIALPDYTKEKQEMIIEKEKLESKLQELKGNLKKEKTKNLVYILFTIVFVLIAAFLLINK